MGLKWRVICACVYTLTNIVGSRWKESAYIKDLSIILPTNS